MSDIDETINPPYYRSHPSGIECIELVEGMDFCAGSAIKYLWRAGLKTPDEETDLRKALWYLERPLEEAFTSTAVLPAIDRFEQWVDDTESDPYGHDQLIAKVLMYDASKVARELREYIETHYG